MDLGLALYISNDLTSKSKIIQDYSDKLSTFFDQKHYGNGLKSISIGIVCISPEYESFYKLQNPKLTKSKTVLIDGLKTIYDHVFECNLKLDYESMKHSNSEVMLKIIATELTKIIDLLTEKKLKTLI